MKKSISLNNEQAVLITNELVRRLINDRISQVVWQDKDKDLRSVTWEDVEEAKAFSDDIELAVITMLPKTSQLAKKPISAKIIYEEVIASRVKSLKKKDAPKRAKLI